jgi:exodeoxyribonuclease V
VPTQSTVTSELTAGQNRALRECLTAAKARQHHLLEGPAGSGKTYLLAHLISELRRHRVSVVCCAPTHKAAATLTRLLREFGLDLRAVTIHALFGLVPDRDAPTEQEVFKRAPNAKPVEADVIIIDEASMIDNWLFGLIEADTIGRGVVHVGDRGQLPPVGEPVSPVFTSISSRSRLTEIVRQSAGNPIIAAAEIIRANQSGGRADWSWLAMNVTPDGNGVYIIDRREGTRAMQTAFTSPLFARGIDACRALAWRNERVDEINESARSWRYSRKALLDSPFLPGETGCAKKAVVLDDEVVIANNSEIKFEAIERAELTWRFGGTGGIAPWSVEIPVWHCVVVQHGGRFELDMPRGRDGERALEHARKRAVAEAKAGCRPRWRELREQRSSLLYADQVYAMTVHRAQGSTFTTVFIDLPDIVRNGNTAEMWKLLYTAVTRASDFVVVITNGSERRS